VGWAITVKGAVSDEPSRNAFGSHLVFGFTECQRLCLCKEVRHQKVMMIADWSNCLTKTDEITWNYFRSLVKKLIKGVLAVGARLTPVDGACLIIHSSAIHHHMLAIALHRQLLEVSRKALQVLAVGKDRDSLGIEETAVPDRKQSHENRQVSLEWRLTKVFIHRSKPREHRLKVFRPNGDHRRKADCRVHGVASSYPVAETKHVCGVDTKLRHF